MGKVSPGNRESKNPKRRRIRNSSNKYLKPGALARLRYSKATSDKSCTDLGKKRVIVLDSKKTINDSGPQNKGNDQSSPILSPDMISFPSTVGPLRMLKHCKLPRTPKTPQIQDMESESRLESLPMELLVKILCHLHHDQLRAVFHVSQRVRKAVLFARQCHFNYTTPDRSRQELLRTRTPLPTEHWPFVCKLDGKALRVSSPHTPKAPRHGPRPPSRLNFAEVRQIAAVLFQESAFPLVPPRLPKPLCQSLASNRVLFYEDELCQAVVQNKLR
ncbi:hypothetical protein HHK36_008708 [Tetracentron sinense]|uniref:F-box domain-containing protein n=1 Tax=Tetracentron sinense TaxID=13715 RepID=A0A835DK84_TETSI|nr:hypothetical protein HHK36_008708 [Tetracentron sinense]